MAGRIPQTFINDLLDRVDIVDVVDGRVKLKKNGKNYLGLCPFHDEKTPSFTVSPDKQFFHCFGCQENGTALTFIMNFERLEFVEAVEALAQQMGLQVPRESGGFERPRVDPDLYAVLARAEQFYRQALKGAQDAVDYLKSRGLTGEAARDFRIGYAPAGWQNLGDALGDLPETKLLDAGLVTRSDGGRVYDRFRDRIIFPIRDTRGRVIGFGGRAMGDDDGPKYLNSPETEVFHKGSELYGLYEARKAVRSLDRLIVVEGYMDVVALAQFGIANVVATLGTATGEMHFKTLFRYVDEVICCFDGDQAGRQAAWKALENALPSLNEHRQLKFVFLPDGEDPDTLVRKQGAQALQRMLDHASPGIEFLLQRLAQGLDLGSVDGRARFAGLMQPYVEKIPAGVLRTLVSQKVADMTGLRGPAQGGAGVRRDDAKRRDGRVMGLSERLLTLLLKNPRLWHDVDEETRRGLLDGMTESSLTAEVLRYVDCNPEADVEELLVQFDEGDAEAILKRLAARRLEIGPDDTKMEFFDCCKSLLRKVRALERRDDLAALKESHDVNALRKYWDKRNSAPE